MKKRLKAWGDTKVIAIVGALVFNENNELLLLKRHSADLGGGKWGTPGGQIETNEVPSEAISRELQEETGIKNVKLLGLGSHEISMPHGKVSLTSYLANIPKSTIIMLDPEEHQDYAWFGLDQLVNTPDILWGIPSILRSFKLLEYKGTDPTLADGSSVKLINLSYLKKEESF